MTTTDTTPDAPPETDPDAPIVGRRKTKAPRVSFTLAVYDSADNESLHKLTARAAVDTASVFGFGAGNTSPGQKILALQNFLLRTLVDDDGVPLQAEIEVVRPASRKPGAELVILDPEDAPSIADLDTIQWRIGGEVFPSESLAAQHAQDNGSSLRRFARLMDDPWATVEQSALEEIVDRVVSAAADRPTGRSAGSSRSQRRRGR